MSSLQNDCALIRARSPLVHNISNYVAMNFAANALLAIGASPLMSFYPLEMEDLVKACDALVINIGCLDAQQIEAMRLAAATASRLGRPWVLDPVGAGVSGARAELCRELTGLGPSVIRGNASEISFLAGADEHGSRGVDSTVESRDAVEAARILARSSGAVVSMSGATDYITDGTRLETVTDGDPIMPRVTAMGCTASSITGAFLAVDPDSFDAALNAMRLMGKAGKKAAGMAAGTGSFAVRFIDCLGEI